MPPWRFKGAGDGKGNKAAAGKRTVKGKQRAAHRRPPARLLARRRSPTTTIERRAETAGRSRHPLRAGLAFVGVAAVTAVTVALLLDGMTDEAPPTRPPAVVATAPQAVEPETPQVIEPEPPAAGEPTARPSLAAVMPQPEPAPPPEDKPPTASAPDEAAEVAPAAPPPQAARDEPEADPLGEPASSGLVAPEPKPEPEAPSDVAATTATARVEAAPDQPAPDPLDANEPEDVPKGLGIAAFEADDIAPAEPAEVPVDTAEPEGAQVTADAPAVAAEALSPTETEEVALLDPEPDTVAAPALRPEESRPSTVAEPEQAEAAEVVALPQSAPAAGAATEAAVEDDEAREAEAPEPAPEPAEVALAADLMPHDLPDPDAPAPLAEAAAEEAPAAEPLPAVAKKALAEVDSLAAEVEKVLVDQPDRDQPVTLSELLPDGLAEPQPAPESEPVATAERDDRATIDSSIPAAAEPQKGAAESPLVQADEAALAEAEPVEEASADEGSVEARAEGAATPDDTAAEIPATADVIADDVLPAPLKPPSILAEYAAVDGIAPAQVAAQADAAEIEAEMAAEADLETHVEVEIEVAPETEDLASALAAELESVTEPSLASLTPTRRPVASSSEAAVSEAAPAMPLVPLPLRRPGAPQIAAVTTLPADQPAAAVAHVNGQARWQRYAVPTLASRDGAPMIALVIDDLGLNRPKTWRTIELPAPLTLAFLTYATGLEEMTSAARARGHELVVHVPMEPIDPRKNPGTNALAVKETQERIIKRLDWGLSRFEGYVGINNHMGSRFTAWPQGMDLVMREMRRRGLLFLDSLTTYRSVAGSLAERHDVPYALRDIFLDNEAESPGAIRRQLDKLEAVALEKGYGVGIGHPYPTTLSVLADWLPRAASRGFHLVPISAVVRHRSELAARTE